MEVLLAIVGGFALFALLLVYNSFSWGFVLMKVWNWFVPAIFVGLPVLGFYQAVALMLVAGVFKHRTSGYQKLTIDGKEIPIESNTKKNIALIIVAPWISLIIIWFIKLFI